MINEEMTVVRYGSRELDVVGRSEPALDLVAERMESGEAVSVVIEPGDATRYRLLIAPMWDPDFSRGWEGIGDGTGYLLVATSYGVTYPLGPACFWGYALDHMELHGNDHTARVVTAYVNSLWNEMFHRASSGVGSSDVYVELASEWET